MVARSVGIPVKLQVRRQALKVAMMYIFVAGLWILFSDEAVEWLVRDSHSRTTISIYKGMAFVLVTGGLLYFFVARLLKKWAEDVRQRQQAEAAQQEAELNKQLALQEQINKIASAVPGVLYTFLLRPDGRMHFPYFSPTVVEQLGINPDQAAVDATEVFAQMHPDDIARVRADIAESARTLSPWWGEFRFRHKDKGVIWIEARSVPRRQGDGNILWHGCAIEVSDRKTEHAALAKAQQKLIESEEKFSKIFCSSPLPISLSTLEDGRYLDVNEAFQKMLGRAHEEIVSHTSEELNLWRQHDQRAEIIERIKKNGAARNVELDFVTRTGELRKVLWSADMLVVGDRRCLLGMSLDITERNQAEAKLRESEQLYRQLFELESDAVLLADKKTHQILDVNLSGQALYGYSREEFLKLRLEDVSAEPELSRVSIKEDERRIPLRWHRKKNGDRFAVEIATSVFQHQGHALKLAAIRDITLRQQVSEMLRETTEQLLEAQRVAGLGSYVFNAADGTWDCSKVLNELFGITDPAFKRDLAGWLQIVHPQDAPEMKRYLLEDVIKGGKSFDRNYRIVRLNDKQERWVHGLGKLARDDQGRATHMIGVIQDITDRRHAEEQMQVQFSALTAAANAIVISDTQGRIEWVNPAFTRLTGYAAEEAIGKTSKLLKSGQHPPAFYAALWSTILAGKVWHGEIVNHRKDGSSYSEEMTITPVRGADGKLAHFVAIKQDVTERRVVERRMQQTQKMEAIGTLAGGIAHDFNNILAAMFGYAYLLQQDTESNPAAQENVGEILKAAGRAKDLVQQILTFSRQREQKQQIIPLDTVVKEAIKFLRASLPAQIKIEMNLSPDAPAVLAEPTQIYQVTVNLATNALHAMEGKPGVLTVNLDEFKPDKDFLKAHPDFCQPLIPGEGDGANAVPASWARLTVADTGQGMDAQTLERIFEPFFTTKPVGKGTGLGLSVVHGIVQSHNGVILVDSQVGRGTVFRIYFPGRQSAAPPCERPLEQTPPGRGEQILVLDDEPALTSVLKRLLARLNYDVTVSNSPREAVQLVREDPAKFGLVITDLTMPELNGLEVTRQIRSIRPDMPVVLASGFTADLSPENLRTAGISDLLEKPISTKALGEIIHRALSPQKHKE
jgi:PAS domain S-box-containing protein